MKDEEKQDKETREPYQPPKGMKGDKKTVKRKEAFLISFDFHCAIVSPACRAAKVGRTIVYEWRKSDPVFAAAWEDIDESQIDMVESNLIRNIRKGKEASTIFYLKSKAKKRGYDDNPAPPQTTIKVKIKKGDE